jgi:putative membrane-bound dehydrogenase-like protein
MMRRRFFRRCVVLCVAVVATAGVRAAAKIVPRATVPDGMELIVAAAPPLVTHPIMGALDPRGRLYVGDAAGLNLDRKGLEAQLPNRVLRLEDADGDGVFDRTTVFADKMTFPQGACWLGDALYVASPPGLWKLTDADGDGVAERREMIVGGFDYDGNAADVHGPFLHPTNGRLYWCHGRKGHRVTQRDGTLVHEGKASGIWSCRPDGSDVRWDALGGMDNPVEVDFLPDGRMLGTVNLYYNQPRGDTLIHWLYGGVYERPDQLGVIAGLPRMLEKMPVVHNYGHVAVSGMTVYRSGALDAGWRGDVLVTYFNTQKVVRTRLVPVGATFTATEHPLLTLDDPDAHLTDVMEDHDGSLLVLDTGGWFRNGCPASLVEKPDLRGAVYRLRKAGGGGGAGPGGRGAEVARGATATGAATEAASLDRARGPAEQLAACEEIARRTTATPAERAVLRRLLAETLDPALEHAAMLAAMTAGAVALDDLRDANASNPDHVRRLLVILDRGGTATGPRDVLRVHARRFLAQADEALVRAALAVLARDAEALARLGHEFAVRLEAGTVPPGELRLLAEVVGANLAQPEAKEILAKMLAHPTRAVRDAAWRVLQRRSGGAADPAWVAPLAASLEKAVATQAGADLAVLLEIIGRMPAKGFDATLRSLVADARQAPAVRVKALGALARASESLDAAAWTLAMETLRAGASPALRVEAARLIARTKLTAEQARALAPVVAAAGALELGELVKIVRRLDAAAARWWAEHLVQSPGLAAIEESVLRTVFSGAPPEIFEKIVGPAVRALAARGEERRRKMETLAAQAQAGRGRAERGAAVFAGSACAACHRVGDVGQALGPDLSRIGQIRGARDLLESIFFPAATIARDYETWSVETADGQAHTGMLRRNTPEGLVLADAAGTETTVAHGAVVTKTTLATSLMPAGLEEAFADEAMLDLIAWLAARR